MTSKVKNEFSGAHFTISQRFSWNGKVIWQSHLAEPYGSAIWQSHMAEPYGWQCHMAEPYGRAIWQSHMAVPYGRATWQSHMAVAPVVRWQRKLLSRFLPRKNDPSERTQTAFGKKKKHRKREEEEEFGIILGSFSASGGQMELIRLFRQSGSKSMRFISQSGRDPLFRCRVANLTCKNHGKNTVWARTHTLIILDMALGHLPLGL